MAGKHVPKPDWLKIKLGRNDRFTQTKSVLQDCSLHTICSSGRCPNMGECWSAGTATYMIGGDICTRACRFCNTACGRPAALNEAEPQNIALAIKLMQLKHAVVTSVDRDDLPDYGSAHWVRTVNAIREMNPGVTLETLIPDFRGKSELIDPILATCPDVISHNLETVRRLTPEMRHIATYDISLKVLARIAQSGITTKTGIMVGLGETSREVLELMQDALDAGVSVITIGQYLQPSRRNVPVAEYIRPEQFDGYREEGLRMGYRKVESGPLVRSSYHAERHL